MATTMQSKAAMLTRHLCNPILAAVALAVVALPGAALTPVAAIDEAFRQKNWAEIERRSLRWAQEINPDVLEVQAMAAAGMTDEAIAAARKSQPWQHPRLLLAAADGSDLPTPRKLEIVKAAFAAAQADAIPSRSRVEGLAQVAIVFARLSADDSAHQAFEAAMANAKLNSRDGAYGILADGLVPVTGTTDAPMWMLDGVASQVGDLPASDEVRVHRALALGYFRVHQTKKANAQLAIALSGAQKLSERREKRVAVQSLARLALDNDELDFARRHGDLDELGVELAVYYARRNEQVKALAEIAKLGSGNLYVSPKQAAALTIINDAIERRATHTAMTYCAMLCQSLGTYEIKVRTRIGQLQAQEGQRDSAKANFLRAKELLPLDPQIAARDVLATLDLALAAEASGLHALAKEAVEAAVEQTMYVSLARRKAERPLSEARSSYALAELGDRAKATEMLLRAWSGTRDLADDYLGGKREKAETLLAIARAARVLAAR
ncbi:hypothetical protein [Caldimonas brevitalea]|uniref:Uncharacterized protein n=1 Tax=Caldimonas brevitalea TaxID=413882 RepID=A0A0G3BKH2_9BURK|nr:hypothetical protein [Caldimonas brevitalea]AKJ27045.1 hypothetical protein AAW51_0354 [Caldimonas brevitalea]